MSVNQKSGNELVLVDTTFLGKPFKRHIYREVMRYFGVSEGETVSESVSDQIVDATHWFAMGRSSAMLETADSLLNRH